MRAVNTRETRYQARPRGCKANPERGALGNLSSRGHNAGARKGDLQGRHDRLPGQNVWNVNPNPLWSTHRSNSPHSFESVASYLGAADPSTRSRSARLAGYEQRCLDEPSAAPLRKSLSHFRPARLIVSGG
jgi:hypothetical protein